MKLKPLNLIELMLMFSDLLLSIYFLCLIIVDWKYDQNYMKYDFEWRSSLLCKMLEYIASIACLLSNFSLLLITWERYLGMKNMTKIGERNYKKIVSTICLATLLTILFSFLPSILFKVS